MGNEMETDRLLLRELTRDDITDLTDFFEDIEATKYLQGTKNPEGIRDWLSLVFQSYEKNGFGPWAIILKNRNQFLGYCGLYLQSDVDGHDEVEILYGLIHRYWGKGYAEEAAKRVHSFGKTEFGIHRFISLIAPENTRSAKVALKTGMTFEKECIMWNKIHHVYTLEST
jgi:ribosomal-protein-alanine N-acetyltransferase